MSNHDIIVKYMTEICGFEMQVENGRYTVIRCQNEKKFFVDKRVDGNLLYGFDVDSALNRSEQYSYKKMAKILDGALP